MTTDLSRREFLKRASAVSIVGAAAPFALNLAAIGEAAAATATDYKALVCVFMYGGNDYANTLVPYDIDSYNTYNNFRSAIAIPRIDVANNLLSPTIPLPDSRQYALAPELKDLVPIFNAGQMAVLLNIGTLVQPTSKAEYLAKNVPLPPKLFSHNDQQSVWQSSSPEGSTKGWGGRIGDLFAAGNGNATFTCVSASGSAVYLAGNTTIPYQVSSNGSISINAIKSSLFGSTACADALRASITAASNHLYEAELASITSRSIEADVQLKSALAGVSEFTTTYPADNSLAAQLKMVAKMIAARDTLGSKRQVFFVSLGGFDTHDGILDVHPMLMDKVGTALNAFHSTMIELGVAGQVTAFTASDFGRTLTTDGDGSDHGWGSMHFVVGGAVNGKNYYGKAPVLANDGDDDVGQGRLLPSMSVDQLGATLASWFGVSDSELTTVVPNISNYTLRNVGFMM